MHTRNADATGAADGGRKGFLKSLDRHSDSDGMEARSDEGVGEKEIRIMFMYDDLQ